jgi:hypothetical protein
MLLAGSVCAVISRKLRNVKNTASVISGTSSQGHTACCGWLEGRAPGRSSVDMAGEPTPANPLHATVADFRRLRQTTDLLKRALDPAHILLMQDRKPS